LVSQTDPRAHGALDDPATLGAIVQHLHAAVHVCDADGRVLDATPGLGALLGADRAELLGHAFEEWVADPQARRAALVGLAVGEAPREVPIVLHGPRGIVRAIETVVAVRDGANGALHVHGMVSALTPAAMGARGGSETSRAAECDRDPLTGCLDRTHLDTLGERLMRDPLTHVGVVIARLEPSGAPVEDLDVRRQLTARFLMRQVRGNEPIIRLGDDEFLVVLAGASAEQVERVGRRVQLLALRGAPGPLSLGWAARKDGESLPEVVARAAAVRVPVPTRDLVEDRRRGEEPAGTAVGDVFTAGRHGR
jgi:GGDEF domain-containing protein